MPDEIRKICRSRQQRVFFGVCGGLSEYFKIDPVLIRILFVLFVFAGGSAILLYIILVLIMPLRPQGQGILIKESKIKELDREAKQNIRGLIQKVSKKAREMDKKAEKREGWFREERGLLGLVLVVFGLVAFLNEFFPRYWPSWRLIWPMGVILIGFYLITKNRKNPSRLAEGKSQGSEIF